MSTILDDLPKILEMGLYSFFLEKNVSSTKGMTSSMTVYCLPSETFHSAREQGREWSNSNYNTFVQIRHPFTPVPFFALFFYEGKS